MSPDNRALGFPSRSDTVTEDGYKCDILDLGIEVLDYIQKADLRLSFQMDKSPVFSRCGSNRGQNSEIYIFNMCHHKISKMCLSVYFKQF